jgi:dTMP kinase
MASIDEKNRRDKPKPSNHMEDSKIRSHIGLFFSFEGLDGSGKSLQAERLSKKLMAMGFPVTIVREPGGSDISEEIRQILLDCKHRSMSPITELFLYEAARSQLISDTIRPTLVNRGIVIADRFADSTVAYQGYGRSLPLSLINDANHWACGETVPQRTYLLDITWEESLRRRQRAALQNDRMEGEEEHFYKSVRKGYRTMAEDEPSRIMLVDGMQTVETIANTILKDAISLLQDYGLDVLAKTEI